MSDIKKSLADQMAEAASPAEEGYTGEPCRHCGRVRVYLRRDGRLICEKCERFQTEDGL